MQTPPTRNLLQLQGYGPTPGEDTPMYGQSPGGLMDMDQARSNSLEEQYAAVMAQLLQAGNAKTAVYELETMCKARAQQLWREVPNVVHRPARYMHLQSLAREFEAQAATWHLVWCLHCSEQPPAGTGGPVVQAAGGQRTARQILADKVTEDAALARCAAVVGWLESLADDSLSAEGEATQPRFSAQEGIWLETQQRRGQGGVVSELDPDAPARLGASLHPDNAAAEERLLQRCWQLIRAGRHADARVLLRASGQPWRAASIGGPTGDWGPLPVGLAAGKLEEDMHQDAQAEEMACEVEMGGPAAARALWKWTCLQVAMQAAASGTAGSRYEAAIYGVLASHLPSVLPLCGSWQDQCWAYCRTWLDQAADAELSAEHAQGHTAGAIVRALGADEVVIDVVCRLTGATKGKAAVQGAVTAAGGAAPTSNSIGSAAEPQSFAAVFSALQGSNLPAVAAASQDPLQQVQQHLIQDAMSALSQHLNSWLVAGNDASTTGMEEEEDVSGLPSKSTRMKAFGCHLLLVLEALGVLYGAVHGEEEVLHSTRIQGMAEQVVMLYTAALMERGKYTLVPAYLCHLPGLPRTTLAHETLIALTQQLEAAPRNLDGSPADQLALDVYNNMAFWFNHSYMQQHQPQQEVGHQLHTNVRAQEARILILSFTQGVRSRSLTGAKPGRAPGPAHEAEVVTHTSPSLLASDVGSSPYSRMCACRWLFYPFLCSSGNTSEQHDGVNTDHSMWLDPLVHCCSVLAELALGDDSCAQAAMHLLEHIVPPGFSAAASSHVDTLGQQAGMLRARAAAYQSEPASAGVAELLTQAEGLLEVANLMCSLLQQLQHWHTYFGLEREAVAWLDMFEAYKELRGAPGVEAEQQHMQQSGSQLLQQMQSDLLTSSWMQGLQALQLDPANEPEPVTLVVTQAQATLQPAQEAAPIGLDQARRHYPILKGAALAALGQQLHASLKQAVALQANAAPDTFDRPSRVPVRITMPSEAEGHITISFNCDWGDAQAVHNTVDVCKDLVQGSLAGAPKVLLVNMIAPRPITHAVCTPCCLATAAVLCARVRHALSVVGGNGIDGDTLVEQLAVGSLPQGLSGAPDQLALANVLSRQQLATVLKLEAEVNVEVLSHQQAQQRG